MKEGYFSLRIKVLENLRRKKVKPQYSKKNLNIISKKTKEQIKKKTKPITSLSKQK